MLMLRDLMTRDLVTLSPETTLRDAIQVLSARHLSGAPVVSGNRVLGVVSVSDVLDFQASTPPVPRERDDQPEADPFGEETPEWDDEDEPPGTFFSELWVDAGAELTERFDTVESSEWDLLGEHTVSEVMNRRVHALPPTADVEAAAEEMQRARIHRVLVMQGEALLGIVTSMDITRAVAEHRLSVRRYVFDRHRDGAADRETGY